MAASAPYRPYRIREPADRRDVESIAADRRLLPRRQNPGYAIAEAGAGNTAEAGIMVNSWRVGRLEDETWIARSFSAQVPDNATLLSHQEALWLIDDCFRNDWASRDLLADLCAAIGIGRLVGPQVTTQTLREDVLNALESGTLLAYRIPRAMSAGAPALRANAAKASADRAPTAPAPGNELPFNQKNGAPPVAATAATWIGLKLVDQTGAPVGNRRYRVETSDGGVEEGSLSATGIALVQGLQPGMCRVFCPYFDPVDEQTYVVNEGEHLADIAERFGYEDDQTIWSDEKNVTLRELRPNPYVLAPGDTLHLPARKPKAESKPTGSEHVFTLQTTPLKLKLVLEIFNGKPLAVEALTAKPAPVEAPRTTGEDGEIELTIVRSSRFLRIALGGHESELDVGRLDPISEDTGINARLVNLGYLHGTLEDADGDELALAIEEFQADAQLPVTGTIDDATRAQLVVMHGS